jgi:hypothetical protein
MKRISREEKEGEERMRKRYDGEWCGELNKGGLGMDTDRSGRDAKDFLSPRGINGMTFLPNLLFNWYKCHHIYTGWCSLVHLTFGGWSHQPVQM